MIPGIVLSGKKFSGKDSVFNYIRTSLAGRPVAHHKWATALREDAIRMMAAVGVQVTVEDLLDRERKEPFVGLLQWYGTDFRRNQDPDYWVIRGMHEIEATNEGYNVRWPGAAPLFWVNTDTRFPNEVLIPKQHGFVAVRLEVSPELQYQRAKALGLSFNELLRRHVSETALDGFDGFDITVDANQPLPNMLADIEGVLLAYGETLRSLS